METYRRWYCTCSGKPIELETREFVEDEPLEPTCRRCGATPSSDPKKTIVSREFATWED
ncbi:MAG: hypothetical protein R2940_09155 [Syntrophotaleaceae bacterium]